MMPLIRILAQPTETELEYITRRVAEWVAAGEIEEWVAPAVVEMIGNYRLENALSSAFKLGRTKTLVERCDEHIAAIRKEKASL